MNAANCRVKRLMSEFGVSSRAHLVRLAIDTGVLTPVLGLSDRAMDSRLTGGVLPEREAQVLALMAQGVSDVAVARVLGVTERTVARLVRQAMTRLRAASRPHAVFVACGLGILRPPSRVGASS
jgi:DNA-binding CsgD family transcriptional regulator